MKPTAEEVKRVEAIATAVAGLARDILGADVEVLWFGSWPAKRAASRSDLDIGVMARRTIPSARMEDFRQAVEDLPTLYAIDVVDLTDVGNTFRSHVLNEGRRI
jgi:predicted nucleotidyltransferase